MTFDEYQKLALVTASMGHGADVETCVRALGLCGEAAEFEGAVRRREHSRRKEAGDVLWYAATLADACGIHGQELGIGDLTAYSHSILFKVPPPLSTEALILTACNVAEMIKKHVGHGKPAPRDRMVNALRLIVHALGCSFDDLGSVAAENIAKLKERYGEKFSIAVASTKPDSDER